MRRKKVTLYTADAAENDIHKLLKVALLNVHVYFYTVLNRIEAFHFERVDVSFQFLVVVRG